MVVSLGFLLGSRLSSRMGFLMFTRGSYYGTALLSVTTYRVFLSSLFGCLFVKECFSAAHDFGTRRSSIKVEIGHYA